MIQWDLIAERRPRNFRRHLAANLIWRQATRENLNNLEGRWVKNFRKGNLASERTSKLFLLIRFFFPAEQDPSSSSQLSIQLPSIRSSFFPGAAPF